MLLAEGGRPLPRPEPSGRVDMQKVYEDIKGQMRKENWSKTRVAMDAAFLPTAFKRASTQPPTVRSHRTAASLWFYQLNKAQPAITKVYPVKPCRELRQWSKRSILAWAHRLEPLVPGRHPWKSELRSPMVWCAKRCFWGMQPASLDPKLE